MKGQVECTLVCPMCGLFGQVQNLNYYNVSIGEVEGKLRVATAHLTFGMGLCEWQPTGGRMFVFESNVSAKSLQMQVVKEALGVDNVVAVDGVFCYYGMIAKDHAGRHLAQTKEDKDYDQLTKIRPKMLEIKT